MLTFFIGKDLWEIVELGYEEPADWNALIANERTTRKEARNKNVQALFHIQIALDKSLFPRISGAKTAKAAWETLQEAYQGSDQVKVVKLQTLKRDFENLKMQEAESISDYCVRVKDVVNKMATLGEAFDELVGSLMSHEERLKETFEAVEKAFSSKLQKMKMQVAATPKTIKVKVNGKAKIIQEVEEEVAQVEEVVSEEEVEVDLIREMFNVTIVTGMVTLKENAD
eukprot:PITA_28808